MRARSTAATIGIGLLLVASACGDDDIATGELQSRYADDVQLVEPEEAAAANAEARASANSAAAGGADTGGEPDDGEQAFDEEGAETVEVDDDRSADEKMFEAFQEFRSCLDDRGTEFIGAPDESGEGPQNDPAYIESLSICAAQSDIVAALEESRSAQEEMTPEQVEERNEGVLNFVDCMEGRGWDVEVSQGSNGLLTPSQMTGPSGESPLAGGNTDLEECAAETQAEAEAEEA